MRNYILSLLLFSGYYMNAQPEELVINGDFSKASPVQSDISFSPSLVMPGQYSITNKAELTNSSFVSPPNSGNYMVVDVGENDSGKKVWYARVKVEAGKTYLFTYKASDVNRNFVNPPQLMSTVNDRSFGDIIELPATHGWIACKAYYMSGDTEGEVILAVENLRTGIIGNDLALDDFSFKETENVIEKALKKAAANIPDESANNKSVVKKTEKNPSVQTEKIISPTKPGASSAVKKESVKVNTGNEIKKEIRPAEESIFSKPPVTEGRLRLGHVYFDQGKSALLRDSYAELNKLVKYMKMYPSIRIRLEGHTDVLGNPEKNQLLSEQRVQSLKNYLVENGIVDTRIECKGYGASKPLNSGRIEALRKLNRRVELVIL
jgi:outer membrane protein OmpA-like peptidoglycan-associated protein